MGGLDQGCKNFRKLPASYCDESQAGRFTVRFQEIPRA
jgi:hypothetical protein